MLFNEPKLLKFAASAAALRAVVRVSVLFNEPKLLKSSVGASYAPIRTVSVLFNEPKLLKSNERLTVLSLTMSFSALQRAEIAEMPPRVLDERAPADVSVLFNEPKLLKSPVRRGVPSL